MFAIRCDSPVFRDFPDQTLIGRNYVSSRHDTLPQAEAALVAVGMDLIRGCAPDEAWLSLDQEKGELKFCWQGDGDMHFYIADESDGDCGDRERHTWIDAKHIW